MILGCVLATTTQAETIHPFHISLAEVEYNAKTKKLEIALRIHPDDLEQALRDLTGKKVVLDKTKNVDKLILKYLAKTFSVKPKSTGEKKVKQKPAKIVWVGKEIKIKWSWLYFEIPLKNGWDGIEITNRILFDQVKKQTNTMLFKQGKKRAAINFTSKKPTHTFHTNMLKLSKNAKQQVDHAPRA